jgi:hypothetical protein
MNLPVRSWKLQMSGGAQTLWLVHPSKRSKFVGRLGQPGDALTQRSFARGRRELARRLVN